MTNLLLCLFFAGFAILTSGAVAAEWIPGRKALVFDTEVARLFVDLDGGSIGDFHLKSTGLNPLAWATPSPGDRSKHGFGHFLCLDRWGPPSDVEGKNGMPYHGEAANTSWTILQDVRVADGILTAEMGATLAKAGLTVRRSLRMSQTAPVFVVREEVTNQNPLGRVYNMVQHPTIGTPFLDETTLVDCNGRKGFAQGGVLPDPEEPSAYWPQAAGPDGELVNLRHLTDNSAPNVVSYTLDGQYGWVTAATPAQRLLIGYLWKTADYPWVSLWRDVRKGRPAARGLEFGTTGLHQPFPILVKKGRIWDRPLFEYLDASETAAKGYMAFLLSIPADFKGVKDVQVKEGRLVLHERTESEPRTWTIDAGALVAQLP